MASPHKPLSVRINFELWLTVSAVVISVCALVVSVVQTRIARQQQTASVWPRLMLSGDVLERNFSINIVNQGVGPAIIRSVSIAHQGKSYDDLGQLLLNTVGREGSGYFMATLEPEMVLKSGDEINLFALTRGDESMSFRLRDIVFRDDSFRFEVVYSDVYGNCWKLRRANRREKVVQLDECPN
jgi:hypothetical protein